MRNSRKHARIVLTLLAVLALAAALAAPAFAQEGGGGAEPGAKPIDKLRPFALLGAAIGAGIVVVGAGMGIGRFAAAAAEGVARQPQAAAQITGAVQLPLFLLEGVAIIAVVTCLLIVLL